MARLPTTYDNFTIATYLRQFMTYEEAPAWVDDCINGALGQMSAMPRYSPQRIFNILKCCDVISTETVLRFSNRKREALGHRLLSERSGRQLAQVARCAAQAIEYHADHHDIDMNTLMLEPTEEELANKPRFTEEDLEIIRSLARSGKLKEMELFMATVEPKPF